MIRGNLFLLILFSAIMAFTFSCEMAQPCDDANGVQANLGFYHIDGSTLVDTLMDSLIVYTLNEKPAIYFDGTETSTNTLALPLSMLSDTSVFIFQFGTGAADTVEFRYTQYTRLVSHECGFINFDNITDIKTTTHRIDSVWIRKDLVEYGDEENVKIYF